MSNTTGPQARFLRFIAAGESAPSRLHQLLQGCLEVREDNCWLQVVSSALAPSKEGASTLTVTMRIILFEADGDLTQKIVSFKEQELSFGAIPMMTERGTFIVDGEELTLQPQRALPSGVYFSRERADVSAHLVLLRDDGGAMGCAELALTRHRKGALSLRFAADIKAPISSLFPGLNKKKELPTKFTDAEELCAWIRLNAAPAIMDKRATQAKIASLQEGLSRSRCSLLVKQGQLWLSLEDIPEDLRVAELLIPHLATLRAGGVKELPLPEASLYTCIAAEDGYDPLTGEVLFASGRELIHGYRHLQERHEFSLSAFYYEESFDEKREEDVWRMSWRAMLSVAGDSALTDELKGAMREAASYEQGEVFAELVKVCCWLLGGLSKTRGVFLPKPSELPLFDETESFAQALWICLQQLRGSIRRNLSKEKNKEGLLPHDLVQTQRFAAKLLATLKARSQP